MDYDSIVAYKPASEGQISQHRIHTFLIWDEAIKLWLDYERKGGWELTYLWNGLDSQGWTDAFIYHDWRIEYVPIQPHVEFVRAVEKARKSM